MTEHGGWGEDGFAKSSVRRGWRDRQIRDYDTIKIREKQPRLAKRTLVEKFVSKVNTTLFKTNIIRD